MTLKPLENPKEFTSKPQICNILLAISMLYKKQGVPRMVESVDKIISTPLLKILTK